MRTLSLILLFFLSVSLSAASAEISEPEKPLIVVIGNSMQDEGIHFPFLEDSLNADIENIWISGSASCWKFAKLWHSVNNWKKMGLSRKPDYAVVVTRHNFITHAHRRTLCEYEEPIAAAIDGDRQLQAVVDSVLGDTYMWHASWVFDSVVESSFLPQMIMVAESAGVQFILARHRATRDAIDPFWSDSLGGREYRNSMAAYLKNHNVPFLDYTLNPEIMIEYYSVGDHLYWSGKTAWTRQMAGDLSAIIAGKDAFNDRTKEENHIFPSPYYLPGNDEAAEGDTIQLLSADSSFSIWSFRDSCNDKGERFLGTDSVCTLVIPSGQTVPRTLYVYGYGQYGKWSATIDITSSKETQPPLPEVCAGPDMALAPGETCELAGCCLDTLQMLLESLHFWWEAIEGNAIIADTQSLITKVTLTDTGRALLRLYVSDGIQIKYDEVVLNACDEGEFNILSPRNSTLAEPGDTITIEWEGIGVKDAVVEYSLDGGLTWNQYRELIMLDSPEWGNVQWIIPQYIFPTTDASIRISTYDQKVWAFSESFEIRESTAIRPQTQHNMQALTRVSFVAYTINGRRIGSYEGFAGCSINHHVHRAGISPQQILFQQKNSSSAESASKLPVTFR